jgi:lactam utilization protein B
MSTSINLNADLGESFGAWTMGADESLLAIVKSANIACGFHAGDPWVMRQTVQRALAQGVSLGAHPAFPDLQGFGRRRMDIPARELEALLIYQIGALQALAAAEGGRVTHVKPHGALSNMASADDTLADTVARAVRALDRELILLAPHTRPWPVRASAPACPWRWRSLPTAPTKTTANWCRAATPRPWCTAPKPAGPMSSACSLNKPWSA